MPPWNRSSIDDVFVDVSAGHDGLAPRSPSSLSRARSGCFLGRCRRSGPQVLRGISAPGAPRFGTRQQLDRIRTYARLVGQGAREADVGGWKGVGVPLRAMYSAVHSSIPSRRVADLSGRYWRLADDRLRGTSRPPARAADYQKTLAAFFCSAPIASI